MRYPKINPFLRFSFLTTLILSLAFLSCKKEKKDDSDGIMALLLANSIRNPVCSSFTPETAASFQQTAALEYRLNNLSYAVTVPQGKQCYFKFTPSASGVYGLRTRYGTYYGFPSSDAKIHLGLIKKNYTKVPASSISFDSENLAANLPASSGGTDWLNLTDLVQFYQNANSSRIVMADGSNCTSDCKIVLEIYQNDQYNDYGCTSNAAMPSTWIRFDESAISLSFRSHFSSSPCYYLFGSPVDTTAQFTQTKTYTGVQTLSMVLAISSPVTSPTTVFNSASSNTNNNAATVSGIATQAGQGRYIKTSYSYTIYDSAFSHTLTNSYTQ